MKVRMEALSWPSYLLRTLSMWRSSALLMLVALHDVLDWRISPDIAKSSCILQCPTGAQGPQRGKTGSKRGPCRVL